MNLLDNPRFPECVDNSMRKELAKCQKIANWKFEHGLTPVEPGIDKHAGAAFASGLEAARFAFYRDGKSQGDATDIGVRAVLAAYGDFRPAAGYKKYKTSDRMAGALTFYFGQHPFAEDEFQPVWLRDKLGIEVQGGFDLPILHPVTRRNLRYSFRFDLLAQDQAGDYWVVDEKSTNQLGDAWAFQWDLDSQMTGYCHGARGLLIKAGLDGDRLKGAVINGVSILKYDYGHMRCPTLREQWEIDRWYKQMVRDFEDWKMAFEAQNHRQVLDHACALYNSPCEYAGLCKARNPERMIEGNFTIHFWNPETRT